jgi:hypothetical protein
MLYAGDQYTVADHANTPLNERAVFHLERPDARGVDEVDQ